MPGLFDALKEGTLGVFTGQAQPGMDPRTGQREGLISAGLATLASGSQDPLEAIAQGAMMGRQVGQQVREQQKMMQQRAELQAFVQEAGVDRDGLTKLLVRTIVAGDFEAAKPLSELLKSLPTEAAPAAVNLQNVSTVVSAAAGAPPEVVARFGEGAQVEVQRDPRTREIFWDSALPSQPAANPFPGGKSTVVVGNEPEGMMTEFGIRADGEQVFLGYKPRAAGAAGGGGQEARREARILATIDEVAATAFGAPEQSSNWLLGSLGQAAGGTGATALMARGLLKVVDPAGSTVEAATAAQQLTGQLVALISGATASDRERSFISGAYTIQPNDSPQAIAVKWAGVQAIAKAKEEGLIVDSTDPAVLAENMKVFDMIEANTVGRLNAGGGGGMGDDGGLEAARARLRGGN